MKFSKPNLNADKSKGNPKNIMEDLIELRDKLYQDLEAVGNAIAHNKHECDLEADRLNQVSIKGVKQSLQLQKDAQLISALQTKADKLHNRLEQLSTQLDQTNKHIDKLSEFLNMFDADLDTNSKKDVDNYQFLLGSINKLNRRVFRPNFFVRILNSIRSLFKK